MDKFRKSLKFRIGCFIGLALLLPAIYLFLIMNSQRFLTTDFVQGFQTGAFVALEIMFLIVIIKSSLLLRDEAKLKAAYIKTKDERQLFILQQTGRTLLPICGVGLGLAAFISIYFSMTVFYTLFGVIIFMAVVKVFLRLYYGRKY